MYERYFEMRERPFSDRLDARAFFTTPDREEALAALECAARFASGHVRIIGDAGVGKTMLLRVFVSRLACAERAILLTPAAEPGDLIREVCRRVNVGATGRGGTQQLLSRLQRQLAQMTREGQRPILMLDQAERLSPEQWMHVEQLAELRSGDERLLTMVVVGRPGMPEQTDRREAERMRQLFQQEIAIGALSESELRSYIRHGLDGAGCRNEELFSDNALTLLHAASGGVPRMINRLADAALTTAYGAGRKRVDADILEELAGGNRPACGNDRVKDESPMNHMRTSAAWAVESESMEPFDWSAQPAPERRAVIYPPWEADEPRSGRRAAWNEIDEDHEEMVSIACAAGEVEAPPTVTANALPAQVATRPEAVPPTADLLARLERAVSLFGLGAAESRQLPPRVPEPAPFSSEAESLALMSFESRLRGLMNQAESRVTELERRAGRLVKPLEHMEERRGRIERACESAQRMEARLSEYAERIAQAADELQQRSAGLVMDAESDEQLRERLANLMIEAAEAVNDLEARFELNRQHEQDYESRCADMRRELARSIRDASAMRSTMDELVVQASGDHARAAARTESLRRDMEEMLSRLDTAVATAEQDARQRMQAQLSASIATEEEQLQAMRSAWTATMEIERRAMQETAEKLLAEWRAACGRELADATSEHAATIREVKSALENMRAETADLISHAREQVQAMTQEQRAGFAAVCVEAEARLEQLRDQHEADGRAREAEMEQARKRHETMLQSLTADMAELETRSGSTGHEVAAIGAQLGEISVSLGRTQRQRDAVVRGLAEAERQMDGMAKRSDAVQAELTAAVRAGEEMIRAATSTSVQLESRQQGAAQLLVDIGAHCERAQALRDQLPRGEEVVGRLHEQLAAAVPVMEKLGELVEAGRRGGESLTLINADAVQHAARMESQRAAAAAVNRQVSDATIAAHDVMADMRRTSQSAQEITAAAQAESERLRDLLADQRGRVGEMMQQLSTAMDGGVETAAQLAGMRDAANGELATLREYCDRAERAVSDLWEGTPKAETVIENLTTLRSVLTAAETTTIQMRATVAEAQQLQEALSATSEAAIEHQESLATWCASAGELSQSGESLIERTRVLSDRVSETMTKVVETTAGQEEALNQYLAHSTHIAQTLETMQGQIEQLDSDLQEALARPVDVLQKAQEQSTQLEGVCAAVKKVFGNLAQTSLQARKDIQAFEERSSAAATRSATLAEETSRAAAMLQQWVQEAIHVQSRLERTLAQSPTLAQTHPGEVLKSVSRLAKPIAGPGTPATAKAGTGSANAMALAASTENPEAEIAGILRDARSARTDKK